MEAFAYQLHHLTQQALYSLPISPNLTSVSSPSLCLEDFMELDTVENSGLVDEPMLPSSDSD